jgi:protein-S-isoprenylcysteine O-methyltransferase Ste14
LHPALIILGSLIGQAVGRSLWIYRPDWLPHVLFHRLGTGLALAGVALLLMAYWMMARAHTTIDPRQHTSRIVSAGIYRISRNPIYLGWFLVTLGAGLRSLSLFQILLAVLMVGLLHWAVVLQEEKYLEDTFGDEYIAYKMRVRRWL